jgi:ribose transport system ATP-binding protein
MQTSPDAAIGGAASPAAPRLALQKQDKRVGATHALKSVDLAFDAGEIHAIVGENGAGKSTLIKLLTGVHPRTSGEIFWNGAPVALATPHEAIELGVNAVHQEVVLCPHLSVAANIFLGDEQTGFGLLRHRAMVREGQKLLDDLGFDLPAGALLSSLTIGQQQLVATARAERRGAKFLIFDEPTAYLTRQEAAALFKLIRRLKANGVTVVYISHRLEEVFELCDRVSVLRDGALVGTRLISQTNEADLIALMINRSIEQIYVKTSVPFGKTIVETVGLTGKGFKDVSITVREGEIVGLCGLVGSGRTEVARAIFGADKITSGEVRVFGRIHPGSPDHSAKLGMALIPESRKSEGLALIRTVGDNLLLAGLPSLFPSGFLRARLGRDIARGIVQRLAIAAASLQQQVGTLSGGNQQKVVIGKWLAAKARLFLFDEPTRGIDIGAKAQIFALIDELVAAGAGVLMISSEQAEIVHVCDRAYVMRGKRIVGELGRADLSEENIVRLGMHQ